jgi:hypothetical protein
MHHLFGLDGWSSRIFWYTELEAVLELSWHLLQVAHTSSAGGLSPLGLLAPVVCDTVLVQVPSTFEYRARSGVSRPWPQRSVGTYISGS